VPVSQSDPWLRFRSPLIEPDVRVSRIRLSDWISREGSRGCANVQCPQLLNPECSEDPFARKLPDAAPMSHLVTTPEKVAHASSDVPIHGSISHEPGPVAEVVRPSPQNRSQDTNGICERFPKTVLNEFYRVAFRKKLYSTLDELQKDIDKWLEEYNERRPHQRRWCYGKTPLQTFIVTVPLAKETMLAA
jgi:Integrase core domain